MKHLVLISVALCLGLTENLKLAAQNAAIPGRPAASTGRTGLDNSGFATLSGSDPSQIAAAIQKKWSASVQSGLSANARGTTILECTVNSKGKMGKVKVTQSSRDASVDAAAISAAKTAGPFSNLPADFTGTKFRLFFFYNLPSTQDRPFCSSLNLPPRKRMQPDERPPRQINGSTPEFSEEARKLRFQGAVILGLVVAADGTPQDVCIEHLLGLGLDEQAVAAVRSWKFNPATQDGEPVPTRIDVEVEFRLY
jgi:TonB family protein